MTTSELQTIMRSARPSVGLRRLMRSGEMCDILPELCALTDRATCGGATHKNVFAHTLKVLDNVAAKSADIALRWAALLHDIAKPVVREWDELSGWTFERHEIVGADMAADILARLGLAGEVSVHKVQRLVRLHMMPQNMDGATDKAVNRLRAMAGDALSDLLALCRADVTTHDRRAAEGIRAEYDALQKRVEDMERAEMRPDIDEETFKAVFEGGLPTDVAADNLAELRWRCGRFVVASRKHKGAGKAVKLNYKWEWHDYAAFIAGLRAIAPAEYARLLMGYMREFYMRRGGEVRAYRESIKAVRYEYGLSKSEVAEFMRVA